MGTLFYWAAMMALAVLAVILVAAALAVVVLFALVAFRHDRPGTLAGPSTATPAESSGDGTAGPTADGRSDPPTR